MNPLMLKGLAGLALTIALVAGYSAWHHHVFQQGVTQEKDRRDKIDLEATAAAQANLAAANERVRVAQASVADTLAQIDAKNKELKNATKNLDALRADLRSGAQRLSIPVTSCSSGAARPSDGSGVASGTGTEARAELLPETAGRLADIAADADEEVRRTNECIDRYSAMKAASDALNN